MYNEEHYRQIDAMRDFYAHMEKLEKSALAEIWHMRKYGTEPIKYVTGTRGYVWPNPPKSPTAFNVSVRRADNAEMFARLYSKRPMDFIEIVDDGIKYFCTITKMFKHKIATDELIVNASVHGKEEINDEN